MENKFTTSFGFTEEEVENVLKDFDISKNMKEVKLWYDGYRIGEKEDIYNPWSILKYADEKELKSYWVNTSSNDIIKMIIKRSYTVKEKLERLLKGEELVVMANFDTTLQNVEQNEDNVWGLFISTGYLKVIEKIDIANYIYRVVFPNLEIKSLFLQIIKSWFLGRVNGAELEGTLNDLINLNFESYKEKFERYVIEMFSFFDVGNSTAENFYHAFVLGMLTTLKDSYYIRSNRESGLGRYDICMEPKDKEKNAFIMEFKVFNENREKNIEDTINNAKKQIEEKQYESDLKSRGYNNIYKVVYAFNGKKVEMEMY